MLETASPRTREPKIVNESSEGITIPYQIYVVKAPQAKIHSSGLGCAITNLLSFLFWKLILVTIQHFFSTHFIWEQYLQFWETIFHFCIDFMITTSRDWHEIMDSGHREYLWLSAFLKRAPGAKDALGNFDEHFTRSWLSHFNYSWDDPQI